MGIIFEGAVRHVHLTSGTTAVDVRDLYSRWKDWVRTGDGAQWEPAFSCVGGEEVGPGTYITTYAFLINGWRVHPQEADHQLVVSGGVLLTPEGDSPILPTLGAYNVQVRYSQPIKTETVAVPGAGIDFNDLLDLADAVETDLTPRQALRLIAAMAGGVLSGAEVNAPVFRAAKANHKPRIVTTSDDDGNRLTVDLDLD